MDNLELRRCFLGIGIFIFGFLLVSAYEEIPEEPLSLRIVYRAAWGAEPPHSSEPLKIHPAPYVIVSHTATEPCFNEAECVYTVRVIQAYHIASHGWDDIAYNFLIGGNGLVYEGRGWNVKGAHTFNYNSKSIGISFIGTFNQHEPTKAQLRAAQRLLEYGVETGNIRKDYKLLGHRQCVATDSPGEVLYGIIQTWAHWSPKP